MGKWAVVVALAALAYTAAGARGDGVVLLPSQLLKVFTEQTQVAVVEVKPDRTVGVDLFISLLDASGESHEVPFLLPLQTMPGEFRVSELTLARFESVHTDPLNKVLERAARMEESARQTPTRLFAASSLIGGPCATVVGAATLLMAPMTRGQAGGGAGTTAGGAVAPALSVATEHARADVYRALEPDEVAALVEMAALPPVVAKALDNYAGRPFALVRLHTVPTPSVGRRKRGVSPREHPGVHFRFSQRMRAASQSRQYDYPLGTGQGWEHPIPLTQVYVTAPDDLPLEVSFPSYKSYTSRSHSYQRSPDIYQGIARGRQVHAASYERAKPDQDVEIRVDPREWGPSQLMIQQQWRRLTILGAWIGFPLLALFSWLVGFFAAVARDRYANEIGLRRAVWKSWLAAQAVLLVPLLIAAFLVLMVPMLWYWTSAFWPIVNLGGVLVAAALTFGATRLAAPEKRGFVWRSVGASLIAAVIYVGAGCALLLAGHALLFRLGR